MNGLSALSSRLSSTKPASAARCWILATFPGRISRAPSQALQDGRNLIRELAAQHRTANPRVFGSVLTGMDREDSDLDVLVDPLPETTLFDLGGLQEVLEEALGVRVDVRTPVDLPPHIGAEVLRQAVPV